MRAIPWTPVRTLPIHHAKGVRRTIVLRRFAHRRLLWTMTRSMGLVILGWGVIYILGICRAMEVAVAHSR